MRVANLFGVQNLFVRSIDVYTSTGCFHDALEDNDELEVCARKRCMSDVPKRAARVADAVLHEDRPDEKQLVATLLESDFII